MNQTRQHRGGKPLPGRSLGVTLSCLLLLATLAIAPGSDARAGELDPVQNSVISTDMFLSWLGNQQNSLGLSQDQVQELRDIRVDFKLKSQSLGREMGRVAETLSHDVGTYPIPLDKVRPSIRRLSDLRGELTLDAISSLSRVQGILKKAQWDKARMDWSARLRASGSTKPPADSGKPSRK